MLKGKRIAILLTNGFEQIEMTSPREALDHAGQFTFLVSPENKVRGWNHHESADEFTVDVPLNVAHAADFDALLLPGGVINPDALRILPEAVAFVRDFFTLGKPVGAICHGPWSLVEANVVRGRKLTSWPSLKTDLQNAGANWVDEELVVCANGPNILVSSRKPEDLGAFNPKIVEIFAASAPRAQSSKEPVHYGF